MLHMQSPQYNNKPDLFSKQRSPSMRTKRVPSMQECLSSQHLKACRSDSPSEIRRRKSQHDSNNLNNSNGKKRNNKVNYVANNCTQDLITSIQDLKDQYKVLLEAYKELIQEKLRNAEELNNTKQENVKLRSQLQESKKSEAALQEKVAQLQGELQKERKTRQKLQTDIYFLMEKAETNKEEQKLKEAIEADKLAGSGRIDQIFCRSFSSESHILSFSLTSAIEDSVSQESTGRKRQHTKVVSNLQPAADFDNIELKTKKDNCNFKKNKKQPLKIQLTEARQGKEPKQLAALNPLNQLISFKSPVAAAGEKKSFKTPSVTQNSSNSKRKKQQKQNIEPKGIKKKSKKLFLQTPPE